MDLDTLKQILNLVREHELSELEVEQDGLRLKFKDSAVLLAAPAPLPAHVRGPCLSGRAHAVPPPRGPRTFRVDIELAV
jgi:hypothetical protein